MNHKVTLVTGAAGEIGHSLLALFHKMGEPVIAIDLQRPDALDPEVEFHQIDVTDEAAINELFRTKDIGRVFHLAGVLSTGGEKNPQLAHSVNVQGSFYLLNAAHQLSVRTGAPVQFIFPSTIAAYGIPTPEEKLRAGAIREDQFLAPITMYGNNKLYVENLGRYFQNSFQLLSNQAVPHIDFRCVRLSGIISAETVPTGGTSDYGPEMLHAAAQGKHYDCFVTPDATLPFLVMPDAVQALVKLSAAPREALKQPVYNVRGFTISADEIRQRVTALFPGASIGYAVHEKRNSIVASWPADTDDSAARRDWGWSPVFNADRAFAEYLAPAIRARYQGEMRRSVSEMSCIGV